MSLAAAIRLAVGGRKGRARLEDERREDIEDDEKPEGEEDKPKDLEEEDKPEGEDEENPEDLEDEDKSEGEDDEEEKMSASERRAFGQGRRAERRRMAAILGASSAEANPGLAAHLAFQSSLSVQKALSALAASGKSATGGLASRMAASRQPKLGGDTAAESVRTATVEGVRNAVLKIHGRR